MPESVRNVPPPPPRKWYEGRINKADAVRLATSSLELLANLKLRDFEFVRRLAEACGNDLRSKKIQAQVQKSIEKNKVRPSEDDIARMQKRVRVSEKNIADTVRELLTRSFIEAQQNAQQEPGERKDFTPNIPTIVDALIEMDETALKKFVKSGSLAYVLAHHQEVIRQRSNELAKSEKLLLPVEHVAETNDPAFYLARLHYKGTFAMTSILEKNCVGTASEYFEDSRVDPDTGRPKIEIFVMMQRWEQASPKDRARAVQSLIGDERVQEAIYSELIELCDPQDHVSSTMSQLFYAVDKEDDTFRTHSYFHSQSLHARDILSTAVTRILNKEKGLLKYTLGINSGDRTALMNAVAKLPALTDIPRLTMEYDTDLNQIVQIETRVGDKSGSLEADNPIAQPALSCVWEIARSHRFNERTGLSETRQLNGLGLFNDILEDFVTRTVPGPNYLLALTRTDASGKMHYALKDFQPAAEIAWRRDPATWPERERGDIEYLAGEFVIDRDRTIEAIEIMQTLPVEIVLDGNATQVQRDALVDVRKSLQIDGGRRTEIQLMNLKRVGEMLLIGALGSFDADALEYVGNRIITRASDTSFESLARGDIQIGAAGKFRAPNMQEGRVYVSNDDISFEAIEYDCPIPLTRLKE